MPKKKNAKPKKEEVSRSEVDKETEIEAVRMRVRQGFLTQEEGQKEIEVIESK